jgi:hypothetical protein
VTFLATFAASRPGAFRIVGEVIGIVLFAAAYLFL